MAAITAGVIAAGATAYAANKQSSAAKSAAKSGQQSAQAGIDLQREQFDKFQNNIQPYLGAGTSALSRLQAVNDGNYTDFYNAPDYKAALEQGNQALTRSAAARGALRSGGTDVDLLKYGQNMASQQLGNYRSNLMGLAQLGQNSAVGAGQMGQQSANAISGLYGQQGQAAANGAIGSANAMSNGLSGLAGIAGQYAASRQSSYGSNSPNPGAMSNFGNNLNNFRYS